MKTPEKEEHGLFSSRAQKRSGEDLLKPLSKKPKLDVEDEAGSMAIGPEKVPTGFSNSATLQTEQHEIGAFAGPVQRKIYIYFIVLITFLTLKQLSIHLVPLRLF